jgi:hypothetical protein
MKFLMVMIICFAEDACQAIFDATEFRTYDECISQGHYVSQYMKEVYSTSAGEIWCLTPDEISEYRLYLEKGGKPGLSPDHPQHRKSSNI